MRKWILCVLIPLFITSGCSSLHYKGPKSDHFDGERFFDPLKPNFGKSFFTFMKWRLSGERTPWPEDVKIKQLKVKQERTKVGELSITFINHATVLVQLDGVNILTDPIWSKRTSPVSWAGPARVKLPGVKFEDLPSIDVVFISHNHYDHMDLPTLERLQKKHEPVFIVGLGNSHHFRGLGLTKVKELDWNQKHVVKGVEFNFLRCQHWSKRSLWDRNRSLWGAGAFVGKDKKVYFAGDTGFSLHFAEAGKKFGSFDVALLPIGAYEPRWFMSYSHINPEEAVLAHKALNAKRSVGIHFGTFPLTDEGIDAPKRDLMKALKKLGVPEKSFWVPENGQTMPN